jgi:MoaD family protein
LQQQSKNAVNVHVQFFSRLREVAGASECELQVPEGSTVADLLDLLYTRTPALRDWDKSILIGARVEFVNRDYLLQSGDQISIMPPVQGG